MPSRPCHTADRYSVDLTKDTRIHVPCAALLIRGRLLFNYQGKKWRRMGGGDGKPTGVAGSNQGSRLANRQELTCVSIDSLAKASVGHR